MLFSSITFLYYFLPVVLAVYALVPRRGKNMVLLLASLFFYAWPEWRGVWDNVYLKLLLGSAFSGWLLGFFIDRYRGSFYAKLAMIGSVAFSIGILGVFKYADFLIRSVNRLLFGITNPEEFLMGLLGIALPVGISFYTFQILSYTIDLYQGRVKLQRNFFKFATYVALFPQLIAGPIVRYATVEEALNYRHVSISDFGAGSARFVAGLGKKVLMANVLGELCQLYKASDEISILFTWLYVLSLAFQIYFDFSGYSDMAIGLGRMFGFHFPENFQYPYIAGSVTEFWRRWHISLGSWFRDYVYIPLGGSRKGAARHVINILIVWLLTGLWHGAGWNFIVWGLYFAALLLLEKYALQRLWDRLPGFIPWLFTAFAVLISWFFFDGDSMGQAVTRIGQLFGAGGIALAGQRSLYYLRSYAVPLMVACVGATPLPKRLYERLMERPKSSAALAILQPLAVAVLLIVVTAYLVDGSFNPFIYFRF